MTRIHTGCVVNGTIKIAFLVCAPWEFGAPLRERNARRNIEDRRVVTCATDRGVFTRHAAQQ